LVAGIIQFLLATFPVLSLRLLCSRPLPWPNISPFLQTPWRPPWHFFLLFSSNLTAWTYHSDLILSVYPVCEHQSSWVSFHFLSDFS
jgi:hypothetical protein